MKHPCCAAYAAQGIGRRPRLAAIGADPTRTTPRPDASILAATDPVLLLHCPATDRTRKLAALYDPVPRTRQPIRLSPCWQAYPPVPLDDIWQSGGSCRGRDPAASATVIERLISIQAEAGSVHLQHARVYSGDGWVGWFSAGPLSRTD